ncbi:hypothetical protein PROFUN_12321 [Planoprotostelium fungivorum]|uniref:LIM zinc-binding domain-containing protein n=1 Tax=Planoprotostelium fungivorum TaxID=1890364 RepID=A0A2P6N7V7_9EUKA|nr:hypothetical protein PROFUN_12321 [Planoprotostelium fungivorum]
MDDLDSLLSDLGRRRGTQDESTSARKARPPTSRVDLNELASLMEVLAAPTPQQAEAKPAPVASPPVVPAAAQASARASSNTTVDDLDALMESLSAASNAQARAPTRPGTTVSKQIGSSMAAFSEPVSEPGSSYNSLRSPGDHSRPVSSVYTSPPQVRNSIAGTDQAYTGYQAPPVYNASPAYNGSPAYNPNPSRPVSTMYGSELPPPPAYNAPPSYTGYRDSTNLSMSNNLPPPVVPGVRKPDELDTLLNNLNSQMDNIAAVQSTMPTPDIGGGGAGKATCKTCQQPIYGEIIQALRSSYHPEHFACGQCRSPIGTGLFFEYNNAATCERCYKELCCPKCAHCDKPITDRCVTAIGKKWHSDHFICTQCLRPFENGVFFERDGRPYCEADFYNVFAPKCAGCSEPVRGDCITALGTQWHPEHFECNFCRKSLVNSTFFEYGGKPFCEAHYHMQSGSVCGGCGKVIVGRSITAFGKKWHPEEFVCAFCAFPLSGGSYTEHNQKPYCKECHGTLFG